jgi:hypothetical protein
MSYHKKEFSMKNLIKLLGIAALVAVIGFSFISCGDGGGGGGGGRPNPNPNPNPNPPPGGDSALSGNITITPAGPVEIYTTLTANYTGTEDVSYQWKRGTTNVGDSSYYRTSIYPDQGGIYTVTVSATGYISKTSNAVTVIIPDSVQPDIEEEFSYYLINNATAYSVGKGTTTSGVLTIPNSKNGLPVTGIRNYAFDSTSITSVIIPGSVTSIGNSAFSSCYNLTSVTIPDSVTSIGNRAFSGCESLTSVTISTSVTSIGDSTFYNCESLTSITIPAGVTSIGSYAFAYCERLTSVTIPSSVTSIGSNAFSSCESLTSVTIPSGVTSIGDWTFYGCGLTSVTIPASVTSIGRYAFAFCSDLTSVTIPAGVTSIGRSAFMYCRGISTITIPAGVTSVGLEAFANWTASQTINVQGKADQAAADAAWGAAWRDSCSAKINYTM